MNSVDLQIVSYAFRWKREMLFTFKGRERKNVLHLYWEMHLNDIQIEEVKSIFHFDKSLMKFRSHFAGTDLGTDFS